MGSFVEDFVRGIATLADVNMYRSRWSQEQVDSIMGTEGTPAISAESDQSVIKYSFESFIEDIDFQGNEELPFDIDVINKQSKARLW